MNCSRPAWGSAALVTLLALLPPLVVPQSTVAAPFAPTDPKEVLERLPTRLGSRDQTSIAALRKRLRAAPDDAVAAADLAERYYRIAQRQGDPRYIGYAQAVLAPWQGHPDPPADIRLARSLLTQFLHDFDAARRDLDAVLAKTPNDLAALSYRAILNVVSARYDAARIDCANLQKYGSGLIVETCLPTVEALTGHAEPAYRQLQNSLRRHPDAPPNERLWVLTRLAEVSLRLGRIAQADAHFREALAIGITDQYLLATYAEHLLDQKQAATVIALLRGHTANDVLLLRLALAEKLTGHADANTHASVLADRFEANRRRGDTTHLADEAVFELVFRQNAPRALALASENWGQEQREPSDARILLESALAAGQPAAAEPVRQWLQASQIEHAGLRQLANRLSGAEQSRR